MDYSEEFARYPYNHPGILRIYRLLGRNNVSSWDNICRYHRAKLLISSSGRDGLKPEPGI
jgi:hypothetical protein